MTNINLSKDLQIFRTLNGIVLLRPDEPAYKSALHQNLSHTVKSILALPYHVYFYDCNSRFQLSNEICAEACGFSSPKAAFNKTLFDTGKPESAKIIYENNNDVLKKSSMKIVEEELIFRNGDLSGQGVSIKWPWYDMNQKIIGLFGITAMFGKHKLDDLLTQALDIGFLAQDKYLHALNSNELHFSLREREIIQLIIKKNTSKEIAKLLYVSPRTVEKHIENIKNKLNVKSKAEIIEKIMNQQTNNLFSLYTKPL